MKITSLRVYEGNNIKRRKRIIRMCIENASDSDIRKYLKAYFKVSFLLGYKEKLIDIEKSENLYNIWLTYTEEELSKYILNNITYNMENYESLVEKADTLVEKGFLYDVVKAFRKREVPVIEISESLFQIGYGKNSVVIGKSFQSYENMIKVEISRNRRILWQQLRYAQISKVDGKVLYSIEEIKEVAEFKFPINIRSIDKTTDIKITISDEEELNKVLDNMMKIYTRAFVYSGNVKYRVICYKGDTGVLLKKENGYKLIDIHGDSLEILELSKALEKLKSFCKSVYKSIPIEFMYIDLQEDTELKAVDLGCVFDIGEELGEARDEVIEYYADCLIKEGVGLIPIFSVTGTNGKTTTSRLIYNILNRLGYKAAMTSTGGIYVGDRKIRNGDTTGFLSARSVLKNLEVEMAVMETARGGLYKNGLGYEKAAAAIITSVSEDHIGMDGIKHLDDLLNIKATILEELAHNGKAVIKAQEEVRKYITSLENVCLFNIEKNNMIQEHMDRGGEAYYLEGNYIVNFKDGMTRKLVDVRELPFTHGGFSKGNILNIMSAIAAVTTVHEDTESIIDSLRDLKCDLYINAGRQNIIDIENFKVILDYGHNAEAFNEVLSIAKSLKPSKLTAIIAAAGDRMNKYIMELGTIAAGYCDNIIIREQNDLRGRRPGESAGLIRDGVLLGNFDESRIKVIFKEEDALTYAMEKAEADEVIVLFTQCLDVIIPVINEFLKKRGKEPIAEGLDFSH